MVYLCVNYSLAWIKMAEYYYYGALDKSPNRETAVEMYGRAALAGDLQVRTVHYCKVSILQHITQMLLLLMMKGVQLSIIVMYSI